MAARKKPAKTAAKKTAKKAVKKTVKKAVKKKAVPKAAKKAAKTLSAKTSFVGQAAPSFTFPTDDGKNISLSDFKGQRVLLYFYPKDDTPGCTAQACDLRDNMAAFARTNTVVIGVSKDDVKSHQKFKEKYRLNYLLGSDSSGVCEKYGVWVEKNMYGRKYMGIERSTFLIDEKGVVRGEWRKVNVGSHAGDLKKAIAAL